MSQLRIIDAIDDAGFRVGFQGADEQMRQGGGFHNAVVVQQIGRGLQPRAQHTGALRGARLDRRQDAQVGRIAWGGGTDGVIRAVVEHAAEYRKHRNGGVIEKGQKL